MKVVCAWHQPEPITIAEKCPAKGCGAIASVSPALDLAFCPNPRCVTFCFPIGEGGETHSMCDECRAAILADDRSATIPNERDRGRAVILQPVIDDFRSS